MLLCFHVMAFDVPYAQQEKQNDKKHRTADKRCQIHGKIGIVGAHSHAHEGVGNEIAVIGCDGSQPDKSAKEPDADGDRETSDHEGQEALCRTYGCAAEDAAGDPLCELSGNGGCESDMQPTQDIEEAQPDQCDKRDGRTHCDLAEHKPPRREADQHHVPVRAAVFEPPQITCVDTDERRHEKVAEKQGVLCPERIPCTFQVRKVILVVCGSDQRGDQRQDEKGDPYRCASDLDQLDRRAGDLDALAGQRSVYGDCSICTAMSFQTKMIAVCVHILKEKPAARHQQEKPPCDKKEYSVIRVHVMKSIDAVARSVHRDKHGCAEVSPRDKISECAPLRYIHQEKPCHAAAQTGAQCGRLVGKDQGDDHLQQIKIEGYRQGLHKKQPVSP